MKKRKKKPSRLSIYKTERAHHKNEFFRRLKHIVTLISNPNVYALIPEKELESIYEVRFRSPRLIVVEGETIPPEIVKDSKHFLSELLKSINVQVLADGTSISFNDYLTVGLSFFLRLGNIEEHKFTTAKELLKACKPFQDFMEFENGYDHAISELQILLLYISVSFSDFNSDIYFIKIDAMKSLERNIGPCFCLELYRRQMEKIQLQLDGNNRPAIRLGWWFGEPEPHVIWNQINCEDLNINSTIKGLKIDVYIQSHALIRLKERMDCALPGLLYFNIHTSLAKAKIHKNKNGEFLFEYSFFDTKAGYLKGEYSEGRIIIRTFLLLTYSGTPEGERLEGSTGLLKEDRKYLAIDKLSTFIKSDIASNERVKEIFVKAGCGSLFEMKDKIHTEPGDITGKSTSELIAGYLGIEPPNGI